METGFLIIITLQNSEINRILINILIFNLCLYDLLNFNKHLLDRLFGLWTKILSYDFSGCLFV